MNDSTASGDSFSGKQKFGKGSRKEIDRSAEEWENANDSILPLPKKVRKILVAGSQAGNSKSHQEFTSDAQSNNNSPSK